jgi:hypothetical protein
MNLPQEFQPLLADIDRLERRLNFILCGVVILEPIFIGVFFR